MQYLGFAINTQIYNANAHTHSLTLSLTLACAGAVVVGEEVHFIPILATALEIILTPPCAITTHITITTIVTIIITTVATIITSNPPVSLLVIFPVCASESVGE